MIGKGIRDIKISGRIRTVATLSLFLLAILVMSPRAVAGETASQIARRTSDLLQRASGISADFTLESQGNKSKGKLKTSGKKFMVSTSGMSTWYNGQTMWTYNDRTQETTVTTPTPSEVAETNPLSLITANIGQFTAYYAKKQPTKGKRLVLKPKNSNVGVKSVAVTIADGTYMPTNVVMTPLNGQPVTVHIHSISTKANFSPSDFVYPSEKYPNVELVDLR